MWAVLALLSVAAGASHDALEYTLALRQRDPATKEWGPFVPLVDTTTVHLHPLLRPIEVPAQLAISFGSRAMFQTPDPMNTVYAGLDACRYANYYSREAAVASIDLKGLLGSLVEMKFRFQWAVEAYRQDGRVFLHWFVYSPIGIHGDAVSERLLHRVIVKCAVLEGDPGSSARKLLLSSSPKDFCVVSLSHEKDMVVARSLPLGYNVLAMSLIQEPRNWEEEDGVQYARSLLPKFRRDQDPQQVVLLAEFLDPRLVTRRWEERVRQWSALDSPDVFGITLYKAVTGVYVLMTVYINQPSVQSAMDLHRRPVSLAVRLRTPTMGVRPWMQALGLATDIAIPTFTAGENDYDDRLDGLAWKLYYQDGRTYSVRAGQGSWLMQLIFPRSITYWRLERSSREPSEYSKATFTLPIRCIGFLYSILLNLCEEERLAVQLCTNSLTVLSTGDGCKVVWVMLEKLDNKVTSLQILARAIQRLVEDFGSGRVITVSLVLGAGKRRTAVTVLYTVGRVPMAVAADRSKE